MRKHLPIIVLGLLFWLISTPLAMAGEADWQVKWLDDGTLQEKVTVNQDISGVDSSWQKSSVNGNLIYTRTIKNWEEYERLTDKLPVKVEQTDYFVCRSTNIKPLPGVAQGTLYSKLDDGGMNLEVEVPGIIRYSSANQVTDNKAVWNIELPGALIGQGYMLKAVTFDGFLLGITILTLGVIFLFIFFVARMRKVDRIIAETYSLDNINLEDDDLE